jgi:hypothetical protein
MYHSKNEPLSAALADVDASDAAFFHALAASTSATPTITSTSSSAPSPYEFGAHDADNLFGAYADPQPQEDLDAASAPWDLYYQSSGVTPNASTPGSSLTVAISTSSSPVAASSHTGRGGNARTAPRQGVKRPLLDRTVSASGVPVPMASPTTAVASSMLSMRLSSDSTKSSVPTPRASAGARATAVRRPKKEDASGNASCSSGSDEPPAKKTKVSRERQLKINAASRRCRKKQKLELQFLRTHVVDLQSALKDQVQLLRSTGSHQARVARLAMFLEESIRHVEDMSSGGRPGTPKASLYNEAELQQLKATADQALAEEAQQAQAEPMPKEEVVPVERCSVRELDPMTGYALSDDRRRSLLHIAAFMRNNISLESQSFSPEVISCLPIEMDGWQLRLAITEKNYTIHNCKFFPYKVEAMYDFCWDTNVASKVSIKQGKNDYCVVTPLDNDVAHVYSKTIGKWSLSVHGVANVSYNSLVCRSFHAESRRAMICQQSVLEDRDFQDESTIPWLFKRWVVFQPRVVDGVEGTFVEAYRTASYATGRLIYKEDNTYDSFCEHLIRRYAESNSLLERTMARDPRFHEHGARSEEDLATELLMADQYEETTSDRMVKDLLLF